MLGKGNKICCEKFYNSLRVLNIYKKRSMPGAMVYVSTNHVLFGLWGCRPRP